VRPPTTTELIQNVYLRAVVKTVVNLLLQIKLSVLLNVKQIIVGQFHWRAKNFVHLVIKNLITIKISFMKEKIVKLFNQNVNNALKTVELEESRNREN
jgi:hypothetical protein